MNDKTTEELLEFPCEFPIKVMGRQSEEFETVVLGIFEKHLDDMNQASVSSKPSGSGNFISLTVVFEATSKEHLDNIYRDLTDHELVLFCL